MVDRLASAKTGFGYGFTPPAEKRGLGVEKPKDRLTYLFEGWLEFAPAKEMIADGNNIQNNYRDSALEVFYSDIERMLKDVPEIESMDEGDIGPLVIKNQGHPRIEQAGLFLSAFYNIIGKEEIVFDIETAEPLDYVGYGLKENKTLLFKADTGKCAGYKSSGAVVNFASAGDGFGSDGNGIAVNMREVIGAMAYMTNGIAINCGRTKSISGNLYHDTSKVINFGDTEYLSGDVCINLGSANQISGHRVINFGSVNQQIDGCEGSVLINCGEARRVFAYNQGGEQSLVLLYNRPRDLSLTGVPYFGRKFFDERPDLKQYLDGLKSSFEKYRGTGYPECMRIGDVDLLSGVRSRLTELLGGAK